MINWWNPVTCRRTKSAHSITLSNPNVQMINQFVVGSCNLFARRFKNRFHRFKAKIILNFSRTFLSDSLYFLGVLYRQPFRWILFVTSEIYLTNQVCWCVHSLFMYYSFSSYIFRVHTVFRCTLVYMFLQQLYTSCISKLRCEFQVISF